MTSNRSVVSSQVGEIIGEDDGEDDGEGVVGEGGDVLH